MPKTRHFSHPQNHSLWLEVSNHLHKTYPPSTANQYSSQISLLLQSLSNPFHSYTDEQLMPLLRNFITTSRRTYHRLYAIKQLLLYTNRTSLLNSLPSTKLLPRQNPNKSLSSEEINHLLQHASPRIHLLILLLRDTGARISAILSSRISDYHKTEDKDFPLSLKCKEKGGKILTYHFTEQTSKHYHEYLRKHHPLRKPPDMPPPPNSLLFPPQKYRSIYHEIYHELSELSITYLNRHITPHYFRHTFAIDVLRASGNPLLVKEALSHSSISTTMRYIQEEGLSQKQALSILKHAKNTQTVQK